MASRSAGRASAQVKAEYALHLRATRGWSYDQIAAATLPCPAHATIGGLTGCQVCLTPLYANRGGAKKAVDRALAEQHPDTAAQRTLMKQDLTSQLEATLATALTLATAKVEVGQAIPAGLLEAQRNVVRIAERLAKLWGLDAPNRVVITTELDEQIQQAVEQFVESVTT